MDIIEAIHSRKSIRDFKPDPVPKDMIKEILNIAVRAPSGVNKQPWEFAVLAGDVLDQIKKANIENLHLQLSGRDHSGSSLDPKSIYRERQVNLAKELFRLMNIPREDKEKRLEWTKRGFRYFNAPAVIILLSDNSLPAERILMDIGAVMQTICLTAIKYQLGTCIEGQGIMFPDVIRKYAKIPESKHMNMAIALGYPNWDFPANAIETPREKIDNITYWSGY